MWTDQQSGYLLTFSQHDDLDMGSSISMLVNGMASLSENIYMAKLNKPFWSIKYAKGNVESFKAWRSKHSKQLILENLSSLESIYKIAIILIWTT